MLDKRMFDWTNGILGVWLVLSPWIVGFASTPGALWSALVLGLAVIAVSAWALYLPARRLPEWVNLALGVLLFVAPWAMGYPALAGAAWNSWLLGAMLAAFAAYTFLPRMRTPQQPLTHH